MLLIAGGSAWRYRSTHGARATDGATSTAGDAVPELPAPSPQRAAQAAGVELDASGEFSQAEEVFFSSSVGASFRQCPKCHRTFPSFFDVCPFDISPLTAMAIESNSAPQPAQAIPRRFCPDCGRRYEGRARHCSVDGHRLLLDSSHTVAEAPSFRICTHCGWHGADTDREVCPRDDHLLVVINPGKSGAVGAPPFPFNRCRQCGLVAPPDQIHCPADGTTLLPASSPAPGALPSTGFGVRRRICPDCGTKFNDQCHYCSLDGTRLISLN